LISLKAGMKFWILLLNELGMDFGFLYED